MGASATDIITYIGVPLAVLGIMPILYTCVKVLITLEKIKHELRRHGSTASAPARSNLMSGIVEIELPRYNLQPLGRENPEYWGQNGVHEAVMLKGGSWMVLNWDKLLVGHKLYRLQYSDELRFEQAEVDFAEMLGFLLDRGAVPDAEGFRVLRALGIRTPSGTALLLSPDRGQVVLKVTTPDHSDGSLSLALAWSPTWNTRGSHSLPPSWTRLAAPETSRSAASERPQTSRTSASEDKSSEASTLVQNEKQVSKRIQSQAVHLHVGPSGLLHAYEERLDGTTGETVELHHLGPDPTSASLWFACAITAIIEQDQRQFWNYSAPLSIIHLAKEKSIPCGIMVLLDVIDEKDTPAWATPHNPNAIHEERHQKFLQRTRRIAAEAKMLPAMAAAAKSAREEEERWDFHNSAQAEIRARKEREAKRTAEALISPRLSNKVIAEANVKWLQKDPSDDSLTLHKALELVLYGMITEESTASAVADMLDQWKAWTENGGMNHSHLEYVRERQRVFAYASCVLAMVGEKLDATSGMAEDLRECMKVLKKVRLG
ncbi:hypothetical protein FGG08_002685 [Glutinoglossum americanum]|uniref:Uncharacterized protein n=1 Tax=Glutinoglossum americanum TaxID=1670608 RepID=A0A9P8I482_9PEZI|nr:hypothetical protein FGG08_002685 [Glutinoglossum americanum]